MKAPIPSPAVSALTGLATLAVSQPLLAHEQVNGSSGLMGFAHDMAHLALVMSELPFLLALAGLAIAMLARRRHRQER